MSDGQKRVVLYRRVSSEGQRDNYSLPAQLDEMTEYCQQLQWIIVADLVDVHTAADLEERKGLQEAIRYIKNQQADVLLVHKMDRLSREPQHAEVIRYHVEKYGGVIDVVKGEKFGDNPIHDAFRYFQFTQSKMERKYIGERTMMGRERRAREDHLPSFGINAPYGYTWEENTVIKDPETRAIVEHIFEMLLSGMSMIAVTGQLNREGIMSPGDYSRLKRGKPIKGSPWHQATIVHMVNNPIYIGYHVAFRWQTKKVRDVDPFSGDVVTHRVNLDRLAGDETDREPITIECPAYIDELQLAQIRAFAKRNKTYSGTRANHVSATWGTGFTYCGHCGRKMFVHYQTRPRRKKDGRRSVIRPRYICSTNHRKREMGIACPANGVSADALDAFVWSTMLELVSDPRFPTQYFQMSRPESVSVYNIVEAYEKKLRAIDEQLDTYARTIGRSGADEDAITLLLEQVKRLHEEKRETEALRNDQIGLERKVKAQQAHFRQMESWISIVKDAAHELTRENIQNVYYGLGVRIVVWHSDHTPHVEILLEHEDGFQYARIASKQVVTLQNPTWSPELQEAVLRRHEPCAGQAEEVDPENNRVEVSQKEGKAIPPKVAKGDTNKVTLASPFAASRTKSCIASPPRTKAGRSIPLPAFRIH